ncbi:MAG TPA: helix-turn-helix transcriptional regulator [Solirubrobacterales bacterium]|nr:helix-turn-helix transcriptional regulator [Solirubrobacterales bacterium]
MSVAEQFASNLVYLRKRARLTQEEVGLRASLHRTEISQLERGLRVARIDTLVKLAGVLGVTPGELLDGICWQPGVFRPGGFHDAGGAGP